MIKLSELELIEKAKKGNKSALNTLLTDNLPILKGYVIKTTGDINIAQDVVQDTLLKAILNISKFQPNAKFSTWLIKIAINIYSDYLRKQHPTELIEETLEDKSQTVEETAISNFEYKQIAEIIKRLPAEKRSVFVLKHYYGYKYDEIAEIVNCPIGTVRSRLHNAVKFITCELERKGII